MHKMFIRRADHYNLANNSGSLANHYVLTRKYPKGIVASNAPIDSPFNLNMKKKIPEKNTGLTYYLRQKKNKLRRRFIYIYI